MNFESLPSKSSTKSTSAFDNFKIAMYVTALFVGIIVVVALLPGNIERKSEVASMLATLSLLALFIVWAWRVLTRKNRATKEVMSKFAVDNGCEFKKEQKLVDKTLFPAYSSSNVLRPRLLFLMSGQVAGSKFEFYEIFFWYTSRSSFSGKGMIKPYYLTVLRVPEKPVKLRERSEIDTTTEGGFTYYYRHIGLQVREPIQELFTAANLDTAVA